MTGIELLERCRSYEGEIHRMNERIERLRDSAKRITPTYRFDEGGRSTVEQDKLSAVVAEIDDIERSIKVRSKEYAEECVAALSIIDRLGDALQEKLIDWYYLRGATIAVAAEKFGYSYGYLRTCLSAARKKIDKIEEAEIDALLPEWYHHEVI